MELKPMAAIYCRLSEEDKHKSSETDDSNSIQNQKSMLSKYALERNWEIYNIYSDDDYTGSDRNRPAFRQLLEDAKNQKFNIILCKTQSRFTRELELVETYIHGLFPIWGIRFISIVDNADTANKGNKKSRQINGLVNEWYLEDMSENIKSVLIDRRKSGYHIGSFALYGYKKDPLSKGHLIIDEEAAAIVREIFMLFSQGYGKTAIARLLNDRGIPNPTEYKRLHGLRYQQPKNKNAALWSYCTISNMLTNEMYIGNMIQGKYGSISYKTKQNKPRPKDQWYRVEGTHEPIIDRDLWNRVQSLIAQRAKPFANGNIGLFAKKAHCMHCGYTMRSSKTSDGRSYLKCPCRHIAKNACIGSFISVSKLEQAVLHELRCLTIKYLNACELEKNVRFNDDLITQKENIEKTIIFYQEKICEYTKGLREAYLDKIKGLLSESDYLDLSNDFGLQKEKFKQALLDNQKQLAILNEKMQAAKNHRQQIKQYLYPKHLNREMVETMIDYISIGKKDSLTQQIPVEIHWNF